MTENVEKVCKDVLRRVTPNRKEKEEIMVLAERLAKRVESASRKLGVEVNVRVEGSVAKDTWLSKEPDIDVFMRVPKAIPRMSLGEVCLKVAKRATVGSKQIERFAEHPYLEAIVDETRVNIVPCYDVKRGEWQSATDRTPFHTDYVKKRLNGQLQSETRLLKKFMKGIGVYGAEIRVGGFSGYLCELLILCYRSFANVLKTFANHKRRIVVDIEDYYRNRERDVQLLFKEPLAVIDPVDKSRNVASAVQTQKLFTFVAAARAFLKGPNLFFFYPQKTKVLTPRELKKKIGNLGSDLVFLIFGKVEAVPDVLWGQLYKSLRSLRKFVQANDFKIVRSIAWSDEKNISMFIFELEQKCISPIKKHLGPPLEKREECEKFLTKHQSNPVVVSGPYIEENRWVVNLTRKYSDVVTMLNEKAKNDGKSVGIAEHVARQIQKDFRILVNEAIVDLHKENAEFAEFFTDFLEGKPKWLKPSVTNEN